MTLNKIKTILRELEKSDVEYIVIAGVGLDGKRGEFTRPHQDLDVLCPLKKLEQIECVLKKLNYSGQRFTNLYKVFDGKGGKIDLGLIYFEGDEGISSGRIALTKFPKSLFYSPQKGILEGFEFKIAPNELLKRWGSNSQFEKDAEFAKNLPVDESSYSKITRVLKE